MGLIMSGTGAVIMALGIVLFILQAGKISRQAKKDASRGQAFKGKELGETAPLTMSSDGPSGQQIGDTVGFDK